MRWEYFESGQSSVISTNSFFKYKGIYVDLKKYYFQIQQSVFPYQTI